MVVSAATEFSCLHTCPPFVEGEFCETTFEKLDDRFFTFTDDVVKAVGQLQDGRFVHFIWEILKESKDRLILVTDVDTDDVLGAQIAAFHLGTKNFTMGAIGVVLSEGAKSEGYKVAGKCTITQQ
jgi:hypothetical protein